MTSGQQLSGNVVIERPVEEVFAFVADPRNDPAWCERVEWCRQVEGARPAVGPRYQARHRPSGYPWPHRRHIEVLESDPPRLIRWHQRDHLASFDITYELRPVAAGTELTQRDRIRWRLPGMRLIGRRIVQRHIGEQHAALKQLLETAGWTSPASW